MQPARKIPPPEWMRAAPAQAVLAALSAEGATARFVGGCVRDALLDRTVQDIDIATSETPERAMALLRRAGIAVHPTGLQHGTVTAVADHRPFEVTTLRRDVETFGRHARVEFTDDWAADAARRDFTMNALYADADGTIYDPTGGLADLDAGRVRFVGDAKLRIEEDALRLLRFFRFHSHYGMSAPDETAVAACAAHAARLDTLSGERLWQETRKLLLAPDPVPTLSLMERRGILSHLLPGADLAALALLLGREAYAVEADAVRRLAALFRGEPASAAGLATRLRLSNADRDRFVALASPMPVPAVDIAAARRQAYRLGIGMVRDRLMIWAERFDKPVRAAIDDLGRWTAPKFPIGGADALALGLPPGPRIGALMRRLEDEWVADDYRPDRATLLARLAALAGATDSLL